MANEKKENDIVEDYERFVFNKMKMYDMEQRQARQFEMEENRRQQQKFEADQDMSRARRNAELEKIHNASDLANLRHQRRMEEIEFQHEEDDARFQERWNQIRNDQRINDERSRANWERMRRNSDNRSQMIDELSDVSFVNTTNNVRELFTAPEVYREREKLEKERRRIQSETINQDKQEGESRVSVPVGQDQSQEREEWKSMLLGYSRALHENLPEKSNIDELTGLSEEEWDIAITKYKSMFGTVEKARESLKTLLEEDCLRKSGAKLANSWVAFKFNADENGEFFKKGVKLNADVDFYSIRNLINNELKLEDNGTEIVFNGNSKRNLIEGPQA